MKKTNFKLFTMFLAGIAFSALTVFAATISISTNFEDGAIQYLKKLVILMDNNNTWITLDWDTLTWKNIYGDNINWNTITGSSIYGEEGMFEKYCNYGWTGCVSYEELTQWWWTSLWSTWTSERIYYNSWNVGIWTNIPAYKFTVSWTGYFENWLYVNWVIWPEDNWDDLKFLADWYLFKNWWGENKLVINSQGYVGIGTNDPQKKLHVAGESQFNWDITMSNDAWIRLWTYWFLWYWSVGDKFWLISNDEDDAIAAKIENKYYYWWRDSLVIKDNGNVGIGTNNPTEKLEVIGTWKFWDRLYFSSFWDIWSYITANWTRPLNFIVNWINTMTMNYQGYVGIGTGTPSAKLHIAKTWDDWYLFKATSIGSKDRFWIHDWWNAYVDGWLWIGINPLEAQGNTQEHALLVNWTSYLSGNVGIGKNPSYKLDVAGTGYFEKWLIVDGTAQIGNNLKLKTVWDHWAIYSNNNLYLYVSWSTQAVVIDTDKNMDVEWDVTATAFYYDSDERLKTDISTIVNPLQKILSLSGYNFTWIKDGRQDIWVIAQEVEKVFPEIVQTNAEWYKSVEYGNLVAPLIEAIKELNAKIDRQAQEIAILKASIQ